MSQARQYIYLIRPTRLGMLVEGPSDTEAGVLARHFEYLERLGRDRVVLMAGRTLHTDEGTFGMVVLTAKSDELAEQIMLDDPAVCEGVMRAELFPYRVSLWASDAMPTD
ncbi:MAG: YciI family protein [Candidatus Eiseniibacteriota bacterium]